MVFVCHFFLFASSLPVPLLHSSSFEFNEPKILISERTTHHGFILPWKFIWVSVWGRETKKKNLMFSDDGLCFVHLWSLTFTTFTPSYYLNTLQEHVGEKVKKILSINLEKIWVSVRWRTDGKKTSYSLFVKPFTSTTLDSSSRKGKPIKYLKHL